MDNKNILLIVTDQQSFLMLNCAGNRYVNTPAMDSIAADGVRFNQAYCTNPVCVPSRFSLFTGRYPSEIGQRSNAWNGTVSEYIKSNGLGHKLKAAGYEVVYGGKEHLPGMRAADLGFDYICSDQRDQLAAEFADYLMQPHERPFFMVASFINPHDICYLALNTFAESEADLRIKINSPVESQSIAETVELPEGMDETEFWEQLCPPLPANHMPQRDEPEAIAMMLNQRNFRKAARESWTEREWRLHRWAYRQLTEQVDRQIATVLDALQVSGMDKDTVVIFTSDHGDHDAAHKLEHKTALYEEAIRVPLIIRDPDCRQPGTVDNSLVCNGIDLFPTICDYAGADIPQELTGLSLKQSAAGLSPASWREELLIESEFGYGLRSGDYLYALYDQGSNREQLYDLQRDPGQTENVVASPEYAPQLERLRKKCSGAV